MRVTRSHIGCIPDASDGCWRSDLVAAGKAAPARDRAILDECTAELRAHTNSARMRYARHQARNRLQLRGVVAELTILIVPPAQGSAIRAHGAAMSGSDAQRDRVLELAYSAGTRLDVRHHAITELTEDVVAPAGCRAIGAQRASQTIARDHRGDFRQPLHQSGLIAVELSAIAQLSLRVGAPAAHGVVGVKHTPVPTADRDRESAGNAHVEYGLERLDLAILIGTPTLDATFAFEQAVAGRACREARTRLGHSVQLQDVGDGDRRVRRRVDSVPMLEQLLQTDVLTCNQPNAAGDQDR